MRDRDVRAAVRVLLRSLHKGEPDTRIVEEMGVWSGSVRIDLAVINGEICGYELKSDRDTLERLPLQADLYSRVFDRVVLVSGERHIEKASALVPDWWGLMSARGDTVQLDAVRPALPNPSPEPYLVAQLLWKEEAVDLLAEHNLDRGWRSKRVKALHERLAAELHFDTLSHGVRARLKCRTEWLGQVVPSELEMAVHGDPDPVL